MVCFLACFGLTKKQKRRRRMPGNKTQPTDQVKGKYVPLDSEKPDAHDSENSFSRNASKESVAVRVKKKVSFNLNVKTYEPLQQEKIEDQFSDGEEKIKWEYEYPSDYRYYNCRDGFDEEDEIKLEESDLDDEEDTDDYDGDDDEGDYTHYNENSDHEVDNVAALLGDGEQKRQIMFSALSESNPSARNRSQYLSSVLNPVENLTQWKGVKAREGIKVKNHQKENIRVEQEDKKHSDPLALNYKHNMSDSQSTMCDLRVDASLSNWLISSEKKPPPRAVPLQKWASC